MHDNSVIKDERERTALMHAATDGSHPFRGLAKLISLEADVNAQDHAGETALIMVIKQFRHYRPHGGSLVSMLLDAGSDPNIRHIYKDPALMWAASFGLKEQIGILLDHGADINARNTFGKGDFMLIHIRASPNNVADKILFKKCCVHREKKQSNCEKSFGLPIFRTPLDGKKGQKFLEKYFKLIKKRDLPLFPPPQKKKSPSYVTH